MVESRLLPIYPAKELLRRTLILLDLHFCLDAITACLELVEMEAKKSRL